MPRARGDTRSEIRRVAAELFAAQGFEKTSLREVAERLGITKAALYYHYPSKAELARGIVQPLADDVAALLSSAESAAEVDRRALLESYFDVMAGHREVLWMVLRDVSVLAGLELFQDMLDWRRRLNVLLIGADATPEQWARATVAVGGLQDCVTNEGDVSVFRTAAVDAAHAALVSGPR
ncbi:TetR family transcriptional regulator [Saccharopolyspora erythraea NRRL 2338]|uniref:Transcriptional regulator, TetR family n=2 Tax=Saccharopolyspora erythraea TaxID=1836 RepID=A4FMT3_SACEN|nr:TetR/AcrR family transcriptional regulator [Saccharopolyspora erythraea]EQD81991.1 TetR family transcriptional regulator [Saccharopolyspora erythraea D]PFG99002.1 TetR family transcriptional regulator [Saccharopolyspora erythraea NRRL 2338]QRK88973.1 TetR/AcrR family transcriptional regulator [Saccharopolyspora erythraea]CAM05358.1 transcriptional regulator, TetR family [Saccharopolyspora erythraea NRRL 2338]